MSLSLNLPKHSTTLFGYGKKLSNFDINCRLILCIKLRKLKNNIAHTLLLIFHSLTLAIMNTRPAIESSNSPVALSAVFNQDASCFAVGLDSGFCSTSDLEMTYAHPH